MTSGHQKNAGPTKNCNESILPENFVMLRIGYS